MSQYRDSQRAILAEARAAWPDVENFFEDLTAERLDWKHLMESFEQSGGIVGLPRLYAVAVWYPLQSADDWGLGGAYQGRCDIYYILGLLDGDGELISDAVTQETLATKGESMSSALKAITDELGILGTSIDSSPANMANSYFLDKQIDLASVMVSVDFVTLAG